MNLQKRIAVVDDDTDIRYTIAQICMLESWTVLPCEDHKDVAALLSKGGADLYLVDYHLPEMDGIDIVRMIRKKSATVPVIILTVEERNHIMNAFMEAGATDYALKPIKAIDLISRIKVHLQHQEMNWLYMNSTKGINDATLNSICRALEQTGDYMDIDQISDLTQITSKSVYRYLKYMYGEKMLEVKYVYGKKPGRPKTLYKLCCLKEQST